MVSLMAPLLLLVFVGSVAPDDEETTIFCDVTGHPWHPVHGCKQLTRQIAPETNERPGGDWGVAFQERTKDAAGKKWRVYYGCAGTPQAPDYVSYCRLEWLPAEENAANSDPRGCWQYSWKRDPEIRATCENPVTMKNDGDLKPDNYPKEPRRLVAPESPGMAELMAIYVTSDTVDTA
ncbi:unnamed protein product, partial [Mesorhabditis spiculigera]